MSRTYLPFIDWMKAVGIFLIVMGHVAGAPSNFLAPPIYPKQLGVAFFLFVMGFSLARETRPRWQVLFNRLFEIYFFGMAIALLISGIMYATSGTLNLSNYLPFLFGANVLFNNFPANPTTWYIGTYFHVLMLWALVVRPLRVRLWMLAVSATVEIATRAFLLSTAGEFIAYMLVPNWMTVFLMGTWFGQRPDLEPLDGNRGHPAARLAGRTGYSLLLAGFAVAWALTVRPHVQEYSFPFMRFSSAGAATDALVTSAAVSLVYFVYTLLFFESSRRLTAPSWVRFLSRNTLIVFIAHMPVFYALSPALRDWGLSYAERSMVQMLVCLVGLAIASQFVRSTIRSQAIRDRLVGRLAALRVGTRSERSG